MQGIGTQKKSLFDTDLSAFKDIDEEEEEEKKMQAKVRKSVDETE